MSQNAALESKPAATPARVSTPVARGFIQRRATDSAVPAAMPESVHRTLSSPGRPLDHGTRGYMESRFGHDFSQVRVHTDSQAGESARAINAHAYTSGNDIAFAPGRYQPETPSGRHLLAHELAHTVQQSGLQRRASDLAVDTAPNSALEHEAESAAHTVSSGGSVSAIGGRAPSSLLSRTPGTAGAAPAPPGATTDADVDLETEPSGFTGKLKHKVRPEGPIPKNGKASVRKFNVDTFHMPGDKGEGAEAIYKQYAASQQLRAIVGLNDQKNPRADLWQSRNPTEELGESWLQRVGWPLADKDKNWQTITGQKQPFPKVEVGGKVETAQIDHIVELQLGGANNPANLRPLDGTPNGASGRNIWQEVRALSEKVRGVSEFAVTDADSVELRFADAKVNGPVWSGSPQAAPWNALKIHFKAMSDRTARAADANTKFIKLSAGASVEEFAVPANWGSANKKVDLAANDFNKSPREMISSMSLKEISWVSATTLALTAGFDLRNRTRIPFKPNQAGGAPTAEFQLAGSLKGDVYGLTLTKKPAGLKIDYPFLSPLTITSYKMSPGGDLDWDGKLKSSVAILGELDVSYSNGLLRVAKGIDPETLKKKRLFGFGLNKAEVGLQLAPTFELDAKLGFDMTVGDKKFVEGDVTLSPDGTGVKGVGNIFLRLPKVEEASSKITYTGGGGRPDDWKVSLKLKGEQIKLGAGYTLVGEATGLVENGQLSFTGEFTTTLPGGNSATLGIRRGNAGEWQLYGKGTFKVPKINSFTAEAIYYFKSGTLIVSVSTPTPFKVPIVNLDGKLNNLTLKIGGDGTIVVTGSGTLSIDRGKAKGSATVELHEGGWFSGDGTVTYQLRENLALTGAVAFTERPEKDQPRLRIKGELKIEELKLFDGKSDEKKLFGIATTIPVPGLSVGTSGLVINIAGSIVAGYSFGPGAIKPLTIGASFNPLDDATDLELTVTGKLSIPASAFVRASISAELAVQLDAFVAKGGAAVGLELTGKIELGGEVFGEVAAKYKDRKLTASLTAGFSAGLDLGFALTAYARVYAESIIGLSAQERVDWVLLQKSLPTGLKVKISAPITYDSSASPSVKFPSAEDVKIEKPDIDPKKMISDLWGRGSGTKTKA